MALRRSGATVAPTPPATGPSPARTEAPRPPRNRLERFAPYVFVAPLLAVFALAQRWVGSGRVQGVFR